MCNRRRSERVPLITTSWDDGHPLDLRLAAMLAGRGVRGTFYVTCEPVNFPVMTGGQMRSLRRMGMEVGSHTVTHAVLTHLDHRQALEELRTSKMRLEDQPQLDHVNGVCDPCEVVGLRPRLPRGAPTDLGRGQVACLPHAGQDAPEARPGHTQLLHQFALGRESAAACRNLCNARTEFDR